MRCKTVIAILFIVFLVACARKDSPKLEGRWEIIKAEGEFKAMNIGTVYEFSGNKLTLSQGNFTNPGTTEINDSTFSFKPDNNERKFIYRYRFNRDTLMAEIDITGGHVFYMVKKQ
jgi:hypothetical protein